MESSCTRASATSLSTLECSLKDPGDMCGSSAPEQSRLSHHPRLVARLLLEPCHYAHSTKLYRKEPKQLYVIFCFGFFSLPESLLVLAFDLPGSSGVLSTLSLPARWLERARVPA